MTGLVRIADILRQIDMKTRVLKTKPFKELLEKRLTKEEIADIEQAAQKEAQELKEKTTAKNVQKSVGY